MLRPHCLFIYLIFAAQTVWAQPLSYAFQTVTTAQGLTSGNVGAIGQDRYGYIWLGTSDGVNCYDGYSVQTFEHQFGDSTSIIPSNVRYIYSDSNGRLWICFLHGLMEYDFSKKQFRQYGAGKISWVGPVIETASGILHIASRQGLVKLETASGNLHLYRDEPNANVLLSTQIGDMQLHRNKLYMSRDTGLVLMDLQSQKTTKVPLPACLRGQRIHRFRIMDDGTVWVTARSAPTLIFRTDLNFQDCRVYRDLEFAQDGLPNIVTAIFKDAQNRLWATTGQAGLALYDAQTDRFQTIDNNPYLPNSIPGNNINCAFQDKNGFIWLGISGIGASWFHPDRNLFQTLLPGSDENNEGSRWARSAVEAPDGTLWLATGSGLFQYDRRTGKYRGFQNRKGKPTVLHDNSVRGLCLDRQGRLWIGTATGVNRYNLASGRMEFLTEKDGLPEAYYLVIAEDRQGTLWFGGTRDGHFYLPAGETKARSIREHPVLGLYAGLFGHSIFEDSRGLLWFGLDGRGLLCFNPTEGTARHWERTPENDSTLIGNFVFNVTEDSNGVIWASTSNGLSAIDPSTFQFTNFDRARGLPANRTSGVLADRHNRIWVGSSQGLLLFDSTRQRIRRFNVHDGLPTDEFSDLSPCKLRDGSFLFSTRRGFLLFDPERYTPRHAELPLLLSSVRVFNRPFDTALNSEELEEIYFPPGQNFFSLEMTALNFRNPRQTWYAYRMEPYDLQWTYTRERLANYTDVPAGNYTFRYKATTDPNNWDVPEQTLRIRVGEYWYRSNWFWSILGLGLLALAGWFALRRVRYRRALHQLERKAQALAKEKAQVQYENLTQQLNPHFLFNSLASLGSLIRFEPQKAGTFLNALSKMYRYMLQSPDNERVRLSDEIEFAGHFIHLQHTRFGDALQVHFDIDEAYANHEIVPVTLQNLLENAIKHNTLDEESPLRIEIVTENGYLLVRNNIQRRNMVETSNKQGLNKLRSLYQYLTDKPLKTSEENGWFIVQIPLLPPRRT